jgi:hypothetical protein
MQDLTNRTLSRETGQGGTGRDGTGAGAVVGQDVCRFRTDRPTDRQMNSSWAHKRHGTHPHGYPGAQGTAPSGCRGPPRVMWQAFSRFVVRLYPATEQRRAVRHCGPCHPQRPMAARLGNPSLQLLGIWAAWCPAWRPSAPCCASVLSTPITAESLELFAMQPLPATARAQSIDSMANNTLTMLRRPGFGRIFVFVNW